MADTFVGVEYKEAAMVSSPWTPRLLWFDKVDLTVDEGNENSSRALLATEVQRPAPALDRNVVSLHRTLCFSVEQNKTIRQTDSASSSSVKAVTETSWNDCYRVEDILRGTFSFFFSASVSPPPFAATSVASSVQHFAVSQRCS